MDVRKMVGNEKRIKESEDNQRMLDIKSEH